jgi:hypothetical protein
VHRFGSALNRHVHLHVCATDGVFVPAAGGAGCFAPPAFLPARPITQADLATVTERVRCRVIRFLQARSPARRFSGSRHARLGEQRVFHRRERADLAHGARRAELLPELGTPAAVLAWAKLMARVGEGFPLECPNVGGDIRLIAFITEPGPIRRILTHLGEPLEPPPVSPARGPPSDWGELVQIHDDRDVFQATDRRTARDRYSQPLSGAGCDPRMSGNCERGRGLRRREKNATEAGAGRYEKPAPDTRAAPPEAHESLIGRKTVEEVPLIGLSLLCRRHFAIVAALGGIRRLPGHGQPRAAFVPGSRERSAAEQGQGERIGRPMALRQASAERGGS